MKLFPGTCRPLLALRFAVRTWMGARRLARWGVRAATLAGAVTITLKALGPAAASNRASLSMPPVAAPGVAPAPPRRGGASTPSTLSSRSDAFLLPATVGGTWTPQGPGPIQSGQVENITNRPVVGAVKTVAAHPTDARVLYVGSVNGGIWRTTNATDASPHWTALTDALSSLSIGALAFDPTDGTRQTLIAGVGRFSSLGGTGGMRTGMLRSTTGGDMWTEINGGGTLTGKNITGIAARGSTIAASVDASDSNNCADLGVFSSTNTGGGFTQVLAGRSYDLASDPSSNGTLYTAVTYGGVCSNGTKPNGVYKSIDSG